MNHVLQLEEHLQIQNSGVSGSDRSHQTSVKTIGTVGGGWTSCSSIFNFQNYGCKRPIKTWQKLQLAKLRVVTSECS